MGERFGFSFENNDRGGIVVTLFDRQAEAPQHIRATGWGHSREAALLDLWTTLQDRREPAEAIVEVERSYRVLTGKMPFRA